MPETFALCWTFTNYGMLYGRRQAYSFLMYDQLSSKLQELGSEKLIADNFSNISNCNYVISRKSENVTAAKLNFIGLSGQQVSGTIILIKDNNNVWKIDNLQNI
jgi:hypothetical protein